jgi:hypothetical protein
VLAIAARAALQAARGAGWAPVFCGSTGVLLGNSTFRDMITRLLREEMRLGPEVTATDLRRAVVDYFMAGDFTDDTRIGALPPPAGSRALAAGQLARAGRRRVRRAVAREQAEQLRRAPAAVATAQGHSLATWRASYDKRGTYRKALVAAAAFAALPLGPAGAEGNAPEDPDPWESDPESADEGGSGGAGAAPVAPEASGAVPPDDGVEDGEDFSNGSIVAIHPILAAGAGGSGGAAASGGQQLQLALAPQPTASPTVLAALQTLWESPPARRGRPPKRAAPGPAPAAPSRPRVAYKPRADAAFLTAFEADGLRRKGTEVLLAACDLLLEGTVDPGWSARRAYVSTDARGSHPNTAAMMYALAGGKTAFNACAVAGCQRCAEAEAALASPP